MDVRDRLWLSLIFCHCAGDLRALLALRLTCPAFLRHLNHVDARTLWTSVTMFMGRLSYAERVLGWPGVLAGAERERVTRANCVADHYVTYEHHVERNTQIHASMGLTKNMCLTGKK